MQIVDGKPYIQQIKELIIEYTKRLVCDLILITNKTIDKKYTAPEGELLVAVEGEDVLGMIAYHRHSDTRCEMKRLYVKPSCRGMKLGEKLIEELIAHARQAGYKKMVLDTIVPLQSAIHLYKKLGFAECEPYYHNPMPDVLYFRKEL